MNVEKFDIFRPFPREKVRRWGSFRSFLFADMYAYIAKYMKVYRESSRLRQLLALSGRLERHDGQMLPAVEIFNRQITYNILRTFHHPDRGGWSLRPASNFAKASSDLASLSELRKADKNAAQGAAAAGS